MNRFHMFRSNIRHLEYYHQYTTLKAFENKCHDYYLLLPLWMVQKGHVQEAVIWRLCKHPKKDIVFNINGRKFIQRWVQDFSQCLNFKSPDVSFFRGGFPEYCKVTRNNPEFFGKKLYLGAGKRTIPQYGGKYDYVLIEDEEDEALVKQHRYKCMPFYKTASPKIFHPMISENKYDIFWPCNFKQITQKGQEFFIRMIAENKLHHVNIVHCGNKPGVGKRLCEKYGVNNITFKGEVDRPTMNKLLSQSLFGINMSNRKDGCPRVSTEVLMSGTPLIIRSKGRLLNYYKRVGVVEINESNFIKRFINAFGNFKMLSNEIKDAIKNELSFDTTNKKNLEMW